MIKELFVLSRKKTFICLILLIVLCIGISLKPINTSIAYDNFYKIYSNKLELLESDSLWTFLPECKEREYLANQISYLIERDEEITTNIEMLEKKINSTLFKDDLDTLNQELKYENTRLQADVKFYDVYKNDTILNNNTLIYCLYIIGILLIASIFYDDIKNGQLQIYKTYRNNLKDIFKLKLLSYFSLLSISTIIFMLIEMILTNGNNSIYNFESLSETFMDLNMNGYIIFKYLNAMINTVLFSTLFISLLLIVRNLVVICTTFFLTMLASFFAFGNIMSSLKYFNLYYLMFVDKLQYNGVNTVLNITKLSLCIIFIVLFYVIYVKDFSIVIFKKSKKQVLKTTNSIIHGLRELLIPSKGILAIAVVLLFSIYQYNTFKMSYDYEEVSYQNFKVNYLGPINEDRYNEILEEYNEIQDCYEKYIEIQKFAEIDPDKYFDLVAENKEVVIKAQNFENIGKLKTEFEEAMMLGLDNLVDNRGANLLVMKDRGIYLIECISILALPLIFVYISFRKQMTLPSFLTVIKTSKTGEKKYLNLCNLLFTLLVIFNTILMVIGHVIRIEKFYPIDLSNTLKDILFAKISLSLSATLVIFIIISILGIILISKLSYLIMNKSSSNK